MNPLMMFLTVALCMSTMCACEHAHFTCVTAGVRAYPSVCVCTLLGPERKLTDEEKTATVAEETDIDAEEPPQLLTTEELNVNRGVTDLDATAKTTDLSDNKVLFPSREPFQR